MEKTGDKVVDLLHKLDSWSDQEDRKGDCGYNPAIKCCFGSTWQAITGPMVNGVIVQRSMLHCNAGPMSSMYLGS